jgi:predicted membrane protein
MTYIPKSNRMWKKDLTFRLFLYILRVYQYEKKSLKVFVPGGLFFYILFFHVYRLYERVHTLVYTPLCHPDVGRIF